MTLWINAIFGYPAKVEVDLLVILQGDLGFGDMPIITDPTVLQVTYTKSINGATQDRISALANTVFPNNIVVTGVDSTYGFWNGPFWQNIEKTGGGITRVAMGAGCSGTSPIYNTELIAVVYDTSECGGDGHFVRDVNNNKVNEASHVILFHELSHAFHWANRSDTHCATGEAQAIGDENLLRAQFGLPKRSSTNQEGGCGAPSPYNPWEGIGCFVVTAVTGSPRSTEVLELHRIRDALLRPTRLGRVLFQKTFAEYYQCAPRIVRDMQADEGLMQQMAKLVVGPLLDLLLLTELHVRHDLASGAADAAIGRVLTEARRRPAHDAGGAAALGAYLALIADRLEGRGPTPAVQPGGEVYAYLATTILASAPSTGTLGWGLARPLALYWQTLATAARSADPVAAARRFLAPAIEAWLVAAPVPWDAPELTAAALEEDFVALQTTVVTSRRVRWRIGEGLLASPGGGPAATLAQALDRAGFLPMVEAARP